MPADHRVPVIDRMMDVLKHLERDRGRPTVRDLAIGSGVPRSTVYRILNTLEAHGMVVRAGADGGYQLGSRLRRARGTCAPRQRIQRMAEIAQPWLSAWPRARGKPPSSPCWTSAAAFAWAVAQGSGRYAVAAARGARFPLHGGRQARCCSLPWTRLSRDSVLRSPLESFTPSTLTDPAVLRTHLARVRRQGWAEDVGEHGVSIRAVAAPVRDSGGRTVAALSIAFFTDRQPTQRAHTARLQCGPAAELQPGPSPARSRARSGTRPDELAGSHLHASALVRPAADGGLLVVAGDDAHALVDLAVMLSGVPISRKARPFFRTPRARARAPPASPAGIVARHLDVAEREAQVARPQFGKAEAGGGEDVLAMGDPLRALELDPEQQLAVRVERPGVAALHVFVGRHAPDRAPRSPPSRARACRAPSPLARLRRPHRPASAPAGRQRRVDPVERGADSGSFRQRRGRRRRVSAWHKRMPCAPRPRIWRNCQAL